MFAIMPEDTTPITNTLKLFLATADILLGLIASVSVP